MSLRYGRTKTNGIGFGCGINFGGYQTLMRIEIVLGNSYIWIALERYDK